MKRPALLLALLLLALSCSDGSLLSRGRSRMKKLRDRVTSEDAYVCLYSTADLPACNFAAGGHTHVKSSRQRREFSESSAELSDNKDASQDTQEKSGTMTIIYKIEGCRPSSLPFALPICKPEDSVGRIVEVRRLFPFIPMGSSGFDPATTLVFPEIDMNQWHRFMRGPWTSAQDSEDTSQPEESKLTQAKNPKHKKVGLTDSVFEKKTMLRKLKKLEQQQGSKDAAFEENDIFSKLNEMRDAQRQVNEQDSSFAKFTAELPYAKAIPYDAEKLRLTNVDANELRYSRSDRSNRIVEDEQRNGDARLGSEFPYNRAIPYDPAKLRYLQRETEFPLYSRSVPSSNEPVQSSSLSGIVDEDYNYAFPYAKAIPYDPTKLGVAKIGSEFPYTRAIPYDPAKLRIARRGSEFPYLKAIPYDPKKLEERFTGIMDNAPANPFLTRGLKSAEHQTKPLDSRVVPFDSSMLDAAKEGSIFPYGKAAPDDTSKIVDTVEISKATGSSGSVKVPARQVKTFRAEKSPSYTQQLRKEKSKRRLENFMASREIEKNIINTGDEDYLEKRTRVARSAMDASSDVSSILDNLDFPSEFPYARAIPFDPLKLTALGEGKGQSIDDPATSDGSKLLERLERASRSFN